MFIRSVADPVARLTLISLAFSHSPGIAALSACVAPPSRRPEAAEKPIHDTRGTADPVVPAVAGEGALADALAIEGCGLLVSVAVPLMR